MNSAQCILSNKAKSKPHNSIIRSQAFKWIRNVFRCWKTNTPYDESTYLAASGRVVSTDVANHRLFYSHVLRAIYQIPLD
ncbi:hypothetical protein CIK86_06015 [Pseudoalteromonas sp. JB197]|nr:hypothetical protein CIK86_06015 [Pseudoalteromonas sp. JB197]